MLVQPLLIASRRYSFLLPIEASTPPIASAANRSLNPATKPTTAANNTKRYARSPVNLSVTTEAKIPAASMQYITAANVAPTSGLKKQFKNNDIGLIF